MVLLKRLGLGWVVDSQIYLELVVCITEERE